MAPLPDKRYLGDGVYVEIEHGILKLTTEGGERVTNTIYLEVSTYLSLVDFYTEAVDAIASGG